MANCNQLASLPFKGLNVKSFDASYSAADMSQTQEQQRFTISEVTVDWHELMIPQCFMRPFVDRANGQLDPRCS